MKTSLKTSFFGFLILLLISACSPVSNHTMMSGALKQQHQLTENDLKNYQYYLSEQVVLIHEETLAKRKLNDSGMQVDKIKVREKVIIPANTPGVFHAYVDQNTIAVKFEDCEGCVLLFGNNGPGTYMLKAQDWDKQGYGHLTYNGKKYVVYPDNMNAGIYIKADIQSKITNQQRTVSGISVGSQP